ncbi:MAG: TolC family protein [Bacteroidia bacterium]|nr:TolC family protein [Bacteroidia bacterium]
MKHWILLIWTLLLTTFSGVAQTRLISLKQTLDLAKQNNLNLQSAQISEQLAKVDQLLSISQVMPRLSAGGSFDYYTKMPAQVIPNKLFGGGEGYTKVAFGLPYVASGSLDYSWPLFQADKWAALKTTALKRKQAANNADLAWENVKISLIRLWYQTEMIQQLMDLNLENQTIANELKNAAESKFKNDVSNPSEFNRSSVLVLGIEEALIANRFALGNNYEAFKLLLHIPASDSVFQQKPGKEIQTLQATESLGKDADRPLLKLKTVAYEVSKSQYLERQLARLPRLSIGGRYVYQAQDSKFFSNSTVSFDYSTIGLKLDFPIFQGGAIHLSGQAAKWQIRSAELEKEIAYDQLQKEHQDWSNELKQAIEKEGILKKKMELAAENLRIALVRYQEGLMGIDEYFNIFYENSTARINFWQNHYNGILYSNLLQLNSFENQ